MSNEKRFNVSMLGYKKEDVIFYFEKMVKEFEEKLKQRDDELALVKNQNKELRLKYEDLLKRTDEINEDRSKIADVLIKANQQAEQVLIDAKMRAEEEKKELEIMIELERERLVDLKQQVKSFKNDALDAVHKYEESIEKIFNGLEE